MRRARDLRASGYTVWVLEGVGQGGSGRGGKGGPGEVSTFDADAAGVRAMIDRDLIRRSLDVR